ncbi:MAG: LLM class F420-dependent oxidoreductase [Acidimicrobiia bacterium]|nr:LLM class F420-dependent oxidoreductase [Acidimicrobiia bacterium]
MDFGINFFPTDTTLQPVELARAVEERGFGSLWFAEHSHIPISRTSPWGGVPDAKPLPEKYWRTHDQFTALAACAVVTSTLRLGSGICLIAQRDPIWTAKEAATVDVLSNGRLQFGIGYGWNIEEMESHGTDFKQRRALTREKVLIMKSLWTDEVSSFEGDLVSLEPSWAWPKPVQKPHPPIIMGAGAGPKTIAHMVEFCDGWIPLGRHELGPKVGEVRQAVEAAGRNPDDFLLINYGTKARPDSIESLLELDFDEAVFAVDSKSPEEVIETLDEISEFVAQYR